MQLCKNHIKTNGNGWIFNEKAAYTEERPTTDGKGHLSGVPTAWDICPTAWDECSTAWNIHSTVWNIYSTAWNIYSTAWNDLETLPSRCFVKEIMGNDD